MRFLLIDKIYTMKIVEIAPKNPESGSMYNPKTMFRLKTMVIATPNAAPPEIPNV